MAFQVSHNGQQVNIDNPDAYNKLSFARKNYFLQQQSQQPQQPQQEMYKSDLATGFTSQVYNPIQPIQEPQQQTTPTLQESVPVSIAKPQSVESASGTTTEAPKTTTATPNASISKDLSQTIQSAYSDFGIAPTSEKQAIHESNIEKGIQQGIYKDAQSAKGDVQKAISQGLSGDQVFNALKTGNTSDQLKQSPKFGEAQKRLQTMNGFVTASGPDQVNMAKNIYAGSQSEQDLINSGYGEILSKARTVNTLNNTQNKTDVAVQDTKKNNDYAKNIVDSIKPNSLQTFLQKTTESPEYQQKLEAKQKAMSEFQTKKDQWDQIDMDTEKEFVGTGATRTYINNVIAQRRKNLLPDLTASQRSYEISSSNLNDYITNVKDQITYAQNDTQQNLQSAQFAYQVNAPLIKAQQEQQIQQQQLTQTAPSIVSEISNEVVGGLQNPQQWNQRAVELAGQGYNKDQIKQQLMGEMQQARQQAGQSFNTYEKQKQAIDIAQKQAIIEKDISAARYKEITGKETIFDLKTGKFITPGASTSSGVYNTNVAKTVSGYTDTQKSIMSSMDIKSISPAEKATLAKYGLSEGDVANYKYAQKAGKWSSGLDDTEYKRINTIIDDVSQDQVTKTFKKTQEAYNFASNVGRGESSTDNQALIYAFAKAMDPDSVVREGEYATVQKYSQTWGDQLGMNINRVFLGQEFISNEAKKNMINTIKTKYNASKDSYNNLRKTKIRMINDISGKEIGEKAIPSDVMEIPTPTTQKTDIKERLLQLRQKQ